MHIGRSSIEGHTEGAATRLSASGAPGLKVGAGVQSAVYSCHGRLRPALLHGLPVHRALPGEIRLLSTKWTPLRGNPSACLFPVLLLISREFWLDSETGRLDR